MHITLVNVYIKPEHVDGFLDLVRANHNGSVQEPGCIRFDVAQSVDDPTHFALWEWYADEAAARAHKETPHYLAYKAGSAEMMARERVAIRYDGLFPESGTRPE